MFLWMRTNCSGLSGDKGGMPGSSCPARAFLAGLACKWSPQRRVTRRNEPLPGAHSFRPQPKSPLQRTPICGFQPRPKSVQNRTPETRALAQSLTRRPMAQISSLVLNPGKQNVLLRGSASGCPAPQDPQLASQRGLFAAKKPPPTYPAPPLLLDGRPKRADL